jgi:hypothetical protein
MKLEIEIEAKKNNSLSVLINDKKLMRMYLMNFEHSTWFLVG